MNRCRSCIHWDRIPHGEPSEEKDFGACARASTQAGKPLDRASRALAYDAVFSAAHLITDPAFGCVQHEPISPPEVVRIESPKVLRQYVARELGDRANRHELERVVRDVAGAGPDGPADWGPYLRAVDFFETLRRQRLRFRADARWPERTEP